MSLSLSVVVTASLQALGWEQSAHRQQVRSLSCMRLHRSFPVHVIRRPSRCVPSCLLPDLPRCSWPLYEPLSPQRDQNECENDRWRKFRACTVFAGRTPFRAFHQLPAQGTRPLCCPHNHIYIYIYIHIASFGRAPPALSGSLFETRAARECCTRRAGIGTWVRPSTSPIEGCS